MRRTASSCRQGKRRTSIRQKSSGKTCRVAFLGNGVFIRGATLDVELRLDALPAFRENSALQTLENINQSLLAPLLTHTTEAPKAAPRTPAPLWQALRSSSNASQFAAITAGADAQPFALVQGPPGTGKTRTILGVCAALLHGDLAEPPPPPQKVEGARACSHHKRRCARRRGLTPLVGCFKPQNGRGAFS